VHYDIQTSDAVVERTIKEASSKKWDHDYFENLAAIGNTSMAEQITGMDTEGVPNIRPTGYPNALLGILHHFGAVWRHSDKIEEKKLRKELARQIAYFTTFEGILRGRVMNDQRKYRITREELSRTPRMFGAVTEFKNAEGQYRTAGGLMECNMDIAKSVDKELYAKMQNDQYVNTEGGEKYNFKENILPYILEKYPQVFAPKSENGMSVSVPTTMTAFYKETLQAIIEYKLNPEYVGKSAAAKNQKDIMVTIQNVMGEKMQSKPYSDKAAPSPEPGGD
jgi:hypothetical protein